MCNRARMDGEPETIATRFGATWLADRPRDNRFNPRELYPKNRAWIVRRRDGVVGLDVMGWDVLAGGANWPMTNVRRLELPQWRRLAADPAHRCLVPLTAFCEWTPRSDPERGIKGEMWFSVSDQPIFAVAGLWQLVDGEAHFAMVTCDANELVRPIHPKAMVTVLAEADWVAWLTADFDTAVALQRPFPADRMAAAGPVFPTRGDGRQAALL